MKLSSVTFLFLFMHTCTFFQAIGSEYRTFEGEDSWLWKIFRNIPLKSWKKDEECSCGIAPRNQSETIVGGVVSHKNAWPWMGAIVYIGDKSPKLFCGLSIINTKYLLTAAHCAEYLKQHGIDNFRAYLGTHDLNDADSIVVPLERVLLHPKYDSDSQAYDVAVLRLKDVLTFSSRVSPICIYPQIGSPYNNSAAIVVGWSLTRFRGVAIQMQAMVNVISNVECTKKFAKSKEPITIGTYMMCALAPSSDSCQGDSGAPLFIQRKPTAAYQQIGIMSFGSGCDSSYPGVYLRLGRVLSWIKTVTHDARYCSSSIV